MQRSNYYGKGAFPGSKVRFPSGPDKVAIQLKIPQELKVSMYMLGIDAGSVAVRAFREEVRRRKPMEDLKKLRTRDPRLNLDDLRRKGRRVKRLLDE